MKRIKTKSERLRDFRDCNFLYELELEREFKQNGDLYLCLLWEFS